MAIANATPLLATAEYTQFSTVESELSLDANGVPIEQRSGLSYDYITQYSYEFSKVLIFCAAYSRGGSSEDLGTSSEFIKTWLNEVSLDNKRLGPCGKCPNLLGWSTILEAPAYVGWL